MQVKFLLALFLLLLCFNQTQAQTWRSLNGPLESDVRDIVIKNDTVYVVALNPGGVFKKRIHSSQWFYMEISEGEGSFRKGLEGPLSIDLDGEGNYYAGGAGIVTIGDGQAYDHFFRSNDYGKTWSEFRNGIESDHTVEDILITKDGDILIGCVGGILIFNREENKFVKVGNTYWAYTFFQYKDTLLAGTIEGIEYSVDDGNTWTEVGTNTQRVYSVSSDNDRFYIGTNQGLYQAEHLTESWTPVGELSSIPINTLFQFGDKVVTGTDSGVFAISPDNDEIQPVLPELEGQRINVINGVEDILYVGSETGLYVCSLAKNTCTLDGVPNSWIRTMNFQNKDTLWVGTTQNIHRYFVNQDQWDSSSVPIENARNIVPVSSDSFLTISTRYFLSCSFEHSTCDSMRFTGSGTTLFDLKQNTAEDLFLASQEPVFKSTDKGENWEVIYTNSDNINFSLFTFSDSLLFINGGDLIKYSLHTDTYKTLNNGVSIITSDGTIYAAVSGIQKSTDFGETWTTVLRGSDITNSGLGGFKFILYDEEGEKLYAITTQGGVYVTKDNGANWGVNEEMYPVYMESAAIGPDGTLYLGTLRAGVFTNTKPLNPPITISNEEEPSTSAPGTFILHQNYPNPFNPSTTVPFELNQAIEVSISLYNVFGQKVREYNIGRKQAGAHHHQIDMNRQASGVYFLRVRAGEHSEIIKISFIK